MLNFIVPALMGAASIGKMFSDQDKEAEDIQANKAIAKYSPWTKLQQRAVRRADPFGTLMQGAASAGAMYQGLSAPSSAAAGAANSATGSSTSGLGLTPYSQPQGFQYAPSPYTSLGASSQVMPYANRPYAQLGLQYGFGGNSGS